MAKNMVGTYNTLKNAIKLHKMDQNNLLLEKFSANGN